MKFITIKRYSPRSQSQDTSSLTTGTRNAKPGFLGILGGLEHCTEISPATESDRLALIAFLESDECKAAVNQK